MRRNSLTSMLGEFVGLHKTPDFRLTSLSNQEINAAVKDEKRLFKDAERPIPPKPRQRYLSESDIRITSSPSPPTSTASSPGGVGQFRKRASSEKQHVTRVSSNPGGAETVHVEMRAKSDNRKKDRPTSLIEKIRRKMSYNKTVAIFESDEEHHKDDDDDIIPPFRLNQRRDSTRSEKLFIPITPVESLPIRIVQVSH